MACQGIKARDLRFHVKLLGKTVGAPDGFGGYLSSWGSFWEGRAKVTFGGLRDKVTGEYLGKSGSAKMTVRKHAPIDAAERVEVQGVQYSVTGADPVMPGSFYRTVYLQLWEHEDANQ